MSTYRNDVAEAFTRMCLAAPDAVVNAYLDGLEVVYNTNDVDREDVLATLADLDPEVANANAGLDSEAELAGLIADQFNDHFWIATEG